MGQPDHRHFGGHHRIRGKSHLFQRLEQHLPHPAEHPHRQLRRHIQPARPLIRWRRRIIGGLRRDLDHRNPMGDFRQIAQNRNRVGTIGILRRQLRHRRRRLAPHDQIKQVEHPPAIGQPQHGAHLIGAGLAGTVGNRLIEQRGRIPRRAFGRPRDQGKGRIADLRPFGVGDLAEQGQHDFGFDAPQIEALAARQDGDRNLADLGGGKDEFYMWGRFFQRFQQRVERRGRQHVHLVDDIDLVARRGRPIVHGINDFTDIPHPGVRGRVHFHHIDMTAFGDGPAGIALPTGVSGRPARAVRPDAVQPLGDDPRRGGLAGAANAGHDEGMRDPVRCECVLQGAHHRLLPDQIGKGFGPVFAGKNAVALLGGI